MRLIKSERTQARAKALRQTMTEPERLLRSILRDRRFIEAKFRRQAPLGDYVVDFVSFPARLVVELDGSNHSQAEQAAFDRARTGILESTGFRVLRIANAQLYRERQIVRDAIALALRRT